MRFQDIYDKFNQKSLSCAEAAEILGISERTFLRKRRRFDDPDFQGAFDRRLGRISPHRAADAEVEAVTKLYEQRYQGFSVKHFHDFAKELHAIERSYSWTKNTLMRAQLVTKSTRGGKHRLRRPRQPMEGMMIHQDGSKHRWIPGVDRLYDLIVTLDDATSRITSAFLVEEEGTFSSMQGIYETIIRYGLFCSFYTDRGGHYFYTPKAGEKVDKGRLTQVGRALKRLGIRHIPAYSPQARGRSERLFGTLQNRLPKELALHGIQTLEAANAYIRDHYIPRHNKQFTVPASEPTSAFTAWAGPPLREILCIQEERTVQSDNTIHFNGLVLQIPKSIYRHHYVRCTLMVHRYDDGCLSVFDGHMCLGRYNRNGQLLEENGLKLAS